MILNGGVGCLDLAKAQKGEGHPVFLAKIDEGIHFGQKEEKNGMYNMLCTVNINKIYGGGGRMPRYGQTPGRHPDLAKFQGGHPDLSGAKYEIIYHHPSPPQ